jgi:hypothetical protein
MVVVELKGLVFLVVIVVLVGRAVAVSKITCPTGRPLTDQ